MKYICLVYTEENKLDALSDEDLAAHICACRAWVSELGTTGRHIYSSAIQSPRSGATVRIRDGRLTVTDGPYAQAQEYLGGFAVFDAKDLNDAIMWASRLEAARIGSVEVRPIFDPDNDCAEPFDRRVASAVRRALLERM